MIDGQSWRGDDDDGDDEVDNPGLENHFSDDDDEDEDVDLFQQQEDELDGQLEQIMEEMRRDMDHEIQQSIDDQLNEQYENYLNDYFEKAEQHHHHQQQPQKGGQVQHDTSLVPRPGVYRMNSMANDPQNQRHDGPWTKTTTTVADINAQIQLVIDQYQATKLDG